MNAPLPCSSRLDPEMFCARDGVETGIYVREGFPLCLDCYRDYRANGIKAAPAAPATAAARAQADLFGGPR